MDFWNKKRNSTEVKHMPAVFLHSWRVVCWEKKVAKVSLKSADLKTRIHAHRLWKTLSCCGEQTLLQQLKSHLKHFTINHLEKTDRQKSQSKIRLQLEVGGKVRLTAKLRIGTFLVRSISHKESLGRQTHWNYVEITVGLCVVFARVIDVFLPVLQDFSVNVYMRETWVDERLKYSHLFPNLTRITLGKSCFRSWVKSRTS